MKRRLILMRHGKSSWADGGISDHDRPLKSRGYRSAGLVAHFLRERDLLPEKVLCSTAVRASSTWDEVARISGWNGRRLDCEVLYLAVPDVIVATIQDLSETATSVLVVGHNPGMEDLAGNWLGRFGPFPTAAIALLEFDLPSWEQLSLQTRPARSEFWTPKDLELRGS